MAISEVYDPMSPAFWPVVDLWDETNDTFNMEIAPPSGWAYAPGQFNMLYVPGIGEVPISISGLTAAGGIVHTIRDVGAVTHALHNLHPGQEVGVRGPFGTGWPVAEAVGTDVVIVAGGIGLAPLRPAMTHILDHRDDYEQVSLLYGARTPQDLLYEDQLAEWRSRFDLEVEVTVDAATRRWRGPVGVVTRLIARAPFDAENTTVMICGPEIMMHFCVRSLLDVDFASSNIYVSMERNMQCGIGLCGHCQFGQHFVCKEGPVFPHDQIARLLAIREV